MGTAQSRREAGEGARSAYVTLAFRGSVSDADVHLGVALIAFPCMESLLLLLWGTEAPLN